MTNRNMSGKVKVRNERGRCIRRCADLEEATMFIADQVGMSSEEVFDHLRHGRAVEDAYGRSYTVEGY